MRATPPPSNSPFPGLSLSQPEKVPEKFRLLNSHLRPTARLRKDLSVLCVAIMVKSYLYVCFIHRLKIKHIAHNGLPTGNTSSRNPSASSRQARPTSSGLRKEKLPQGQDRLSSRLTKRYYAGTSRKASSCLAGAMRAAKPRSLPSHRARPTRTSSRLATKTAAFACGIAKSRPQS